MECLRSPADTGRSSDLNSRLLSFSGNGRVELWSSGDRRIQRTGRRWEAAQENAPSVSGTSAPKCVCSGSATPTGCMSNTRRARPRRARRLPVAALLRAHRRCVARAVRTPLVTGAVGRICRIPAARWRRLGLGALRSDPRRSIRRLPCPLVASRDGVARLTGHVSPHRHHRRRRWPGGVLRRSSAGSATARSRTPSAQTEKREFADALHDADRARQLMPWSGRPWIARGEAELAQGDRSGRGGELPPVDRGGRERLARVADLAIATEGPDSPGGARPRPRPLPAQHGDRARRHGARWRNEPETQTRQTRRVQCDACVTRS